MALTPGQAKCINTLDRSIVVAAGAGSGKTYTLTKRVVHALTSGQVDDIERVCAITFTNKAAGELKSRVKAELRAQGMLEQALKVDEAWISTIHGLCARILRAHAIQLGLDPCFSMIDPALSDQLREQAVEQALQDAQAFEWPEGQRDAIDALFAEYPARSYGPRGDSVQSMVHALMDAASSNERGFDAFEAQQPVPNPAALACVVLDAFEALADAADAQKPNQARQEWAATTRQTCARVRAELERGHAADALWALHALDELQMPKRVGSSDYKEQVAQAVELCQECVMELRLSLAASHLQTLIVLGRLANELYREAKRTQGVLDNDDLLVLASDAVQNYPDIAAQYVDKFQLVMVDEFQDTDQMQLNMIKRLAGPDAQRLCTVGDAQQSIYRFRGADVQVYRRHLQEVRSARADDVIVLPDNFRSHPDVLSLVDCVFDRPDMFDSFMSLKPGRDEGRVKNPLVKGMPRVQVQLTSGAYSGGPKTEQLRQEAADRLADAFADFKRRGHSAGQMAVLLGGMANADVYANALRARGLACVITGGSVFSQSPEAQAVLDLARVASNPFRTQALFNVLSGPLFQLCAEDFVRLTTIVDNADGTPRRGNLCSGLKAHAAWLRSGASLAGWSGQLALAVRVMGQFMDDVGRVPVASLIQRAVVDSGWLTRLEANGAEGLASAGNVYKALRMIESIEDTQAAGPAHVARQFQVLLEQSKEAPGALSASGGDFVRIMTVHASKGLEFPIVAVAEFKELRGDSSKLLCVDLDGTVYLSLDLGNTAADFSGASKLGSMGDLYAGFVRNSGDGVRDSNGEACSFLDEAELERAIRSAEGSLALRAALFEHERIGDVEESKRLLYVALTRAEEALVVSMMGKSTKNNPHATPKSSLGSVVSALAGLEDGFAPGVSHVDFGGLSSALVEHVVVSNAPESEEGEEGEEGKTLGNDMALLGDSAVSTLSGDWLDAASLCDSTDAVADVPTVLSPLSGDRFDAALPSDFADTTVVSLPPSGDRPDAVVESSSIDAAVDMIAEPSSSKDCSNAALSGGLLNIQSRPIGVSSQTPLTCSFDVMSLDVGAYTAELFAVPAPSSRPGVDRTPYAPAHEGIFSYSSVAEASHEGDLLDDLARRFCVSSDEAELPQAMELFLQPFEDEEGDFDFTFSWQEADLSSTVADADDGSWAYTGTSSDDADKATDFGTAFHRLAQYAVATRASGALSKPGVLSAQAPSRLSEMPPKPDESRVQVCSRFSGMLSKPDESRVQALARSCNLDFDQRNRLDQALDRWFASDLCARMAEFEDLRAEVPFFVSVPAVAPGGLPISFAAADTVAADAPASIPSSVPASGASSPLFDVAFAAAPDDQVLLSGSIPIATPDVPSPMPGPAPDAAADAPAPMPGPAPGAAADAPAPMPGPAPGAAADAPAPMPGPAPGAAADAPVSFLEGEIDLLALDPDRNCAVVVDYKTGGRDDELPDELACKHVLQASCYAYAIMLQGVDEVEAHFVRVERSRRDDPTQPQCVHYRFTSADLPTLAQAIAQAYAQAHA